VVQALNGLNVLIVVTASHVLFHSSKIWMPGFAHRAFVAHNLLGHLQDPFVLVLQPSARKRAV
jgi:hypothetical protein